MRRVALTTSLATPLGGYLSALEPHFTVERILPGDSRRATDFDGLVLAGGTDVNPCLYGHSRQTETSEPDDIRDATEKRFIEEAIAADIPVLAICRGMQMLNAALGGALIQHLPTTVIHKQKGVLDAHEIAIDADTRLAEIGGASQVAVNSRHHQAVAPGRLGRGLRVIARRPEDQVVEALDMPDRSFVIGVQWHPEDRVETCAAARRLFAAFAEALG